MWFHVFKDMIDSGDLAKMDGGELKVYLVVKSYTSIASGSSFPSIALIAEKSGISERQTMRALAALEELGYISKTKVGRHNAYQMREKVVIRDSAGEQQAIATWDYIPRGVSEAVTDLKNVMMQGDLAGAKIVNIKTLTVNIMTGDNATQINVNQPDISKLPKEMQEALMAIRPKSEKQ